MFTSIKRTGCPVVCRRCDREALGLCRPTPADGFLVHFPGRRSCQACRPRGASSCDDVELSIGVPSEIWVSGAATLATAGDKNVLSAVVSRVRNLNSSGSADAGRIVALTRLLPRALEACNNRERIFLPLNTRAAAVRIFAVCLADNALAFTLWEMDIPAWCVTVVMLLSLLLVYWLLMPAVIAVSRWEIVRSLTTVRVEEPGDPGPSGEGGAPASGSTPAPASGSTPGATPPTGPERTSSQSADQVFDSGDATLEGTCAPDSTPPNVPEARMRVPEPTQTVEERVARQIGPALREMEWFIEHTNNLEAALRGRLVGQVTPPDLSTPRAKFIWRQLGRTRDALIATVFSRRRIEMWMDQHPCFVDLRSKKWTAERMERAIQELLDEGVGEMTTAYAAKIKAEVLPKKGKPPRLVLDAGTKGQLCSLAVVSCFESLLFHHFGDQSIKHRGKMSAVRQAWNKLNQVKGQLIEGDGSRFDMTVSPKLRHHVEDRILQHICKVMFETGDACDSLGEWAQAGLAERAQNKRKVRYNKRKSFACVVLNAFRASGDRGTSALNWIVNFTIWTSLLVANPNEVVENPHKLFYEARVPTDRVDKNIMKTVNGKIWVTYRFVFEGDDSVVKTDHPMATRPCLERDWKSLGFDMKIKMIGRSDVLTFVGVTTWCDEHGVLADVCLPEVARNLASASWTLSEGNALDNALAFAARSTLHQNYPPLANYYAALARHWKQQSRSSVGVLDREWQYKIYGDYQEDREVEFEELLARREPGWEDPESGWEPCRKIVGHACGGLSRDQEAYFMGLDTLGPDAGDVVLQNLPRRMFA